MSATTTPRRVGISIDSELIKQIEIVRRYVRICVTDNTRRNDLLKELETPNVIDFALRCYLDEFTAKVFREAHGYDHPPAATI